MTFAVASQKYDLPAVSYYEDGKFVEVYWQNGPAYESPTPHKDLFLLRNVDGSEAIGLKLYGVVPDPRRTGAKVEELNEYDLTCEEYREYDWGGRVYTIHSPQKLFYRRGGTTHRVIDAEGVAHCIPAPGHLGCVLRLKSKDPSKPVSFTIPGCTRVPNTC
jgi:hypothetical protein